MFLIFVFIYIFFIQIAYMDSLDMTRHYANHRTFVYDVPRFCNISSDDFMFVANVDRDLSNPGRPSYGIIGVSFFS